MRLTPDGYKKFGPGAPVPKPTRTPVGSVKPGRPPLNIPSSGSDPRKPNFPTKPNRGSGPRPIVGFNKGRGKPKGGPALRKAMLKQAALKKMRRR